MIKKNNVEKERNRYKTKTTGASLLAYERDSIIFFGDIDELSNRFCISYEGFEFDSFSNSMTLRR